MLEYEISLWRNSGECRTPLIAALEREGDRKGKQAKKMEHAVSTVASRKRRVSEQSIVPVMQSASGISSQVGS